MTHRLRSLDAYIVLLSAVALLSIGPLRSTFAALPLIPFLGTLFLFTVPGVVLVHRFFDEHLSGPVIVPVSFALSAGIFALVGVPFLVLHGSLDLYLWVSGAIVAASVVAAVLGILRRKPPAKNRASMRFYLGWLWLPFSLLSAILASTTWQHMPRSPYADVWTYLAHVREFLNTDNLALHEPYFGNLTGTSRLQINGWLLEQATFSRVSGIDPIELVPRYLGPTLVVMSLLAFYALARILFKSEVGALLAASLYALGFLIQLGELWTSRRITEDKYTSWFLFVPIALVFAFLFLQSRKGSPTKKATSMARSNSSAGCTM